MNSTYNELFEAPIFDGKSIKDRWDETVVFEIGGISVDELSEIGQPLF